MVQVGLVPMAALVAPLLVALWVLRLEPQLVELVALVDALASVDMLQEAWKGGKDLVFGGVPFLLKVVFGGFFICSFLFWCFFYEALFLIEEFLVSFSHVRFSLQRCWGLRFKNESMENPSKNHSTASFNQNFILKDEVFITSSQRF